MTDVPRTIITLLSLPGVGTGTVSKLINRVGDNFMGMTISEAVEYMRSLSRRINATEGVVSASEAAADRIIRESEKAGIRIITCFDDDYPENVKSLSDSPPIFYAKGDISGVSLKKTVAVIGTREPTDHGSDAAFRMGRLLAQRDVAVVSGLAIGCDAGGHAGCLSAHGYTLAVLAHGLQSIYPAANRQLAYEILDKGGCWVSEYPVGTRPHRNLFVERDRLQSGLSQAIIVVETGIIGGTMHTVRFAREQGRRIACVKHPAEWAHEDKAQGNAKLIRENTAIGLANEEDMISFIDSLSVNEGNASPKTVNRDNQRTFGF